MQGRTKHALGLDTAAGCSRGGSRQSAGRSSCRPPGPCKAGHLSSLHASSLASWWWSPPLQGACDQLDGGWGGYQGLLWGEAGAACMASSRWLRLFVGHPSAAHGNMEAARRPSAMLPPIEPLQLLGETPPDVASSLEEARAWVHTSAEATPSARLPGMGDATSACASAMPPQQSVPCRERTVRGGGPADPFAGRPGRSGRQQGYCGGAPAAGMVPPCCGGGPVGTACGEFEWARRPGLPSLPTLPCFPAAPALPGLPALPSLPFFSNVQS